VKPRRFPLLGALYDFLFFAPVLVAGVGALSFAVFGLGHYGLLTYERAPAVVAIHFFSYLFTLINTAFAVGAHLVMFGDAKKVDAYNALDAAAKADAPKPFHLVMWAEQPGGSKPKGAHAFDAHIWPPLVHLPPRGVPLYQKGYILVDLPGLALLLLGSPYAYLAMWGCYQTAAMTDHLLLFGGAFPDRLKTILPVKGINLAQYATWVVLTHLTSPMGCAAGVGASALLFAKVALAAVPVHLAMMAMIGARPCKRANGAKSA